MNAGDATIPAVPIPTGGPWGWPVGRPSPRRTFASEGDAATDLYKWIGSLPPEQWPPTQWSAAQAFGVSETTIRRWIRRMGYAHWEDFLMSFTDNRTSQEA